MCSLQSELRYLELRHLKLIALLGHYSCHGEVTSGTGYNCKAIYTCNKQFTFGSVLFGIVDKSLLYQAYRRLRNVVSTI